MNAECIGMGSFTTTNCCIVLIFAVNWFVLRICHIATCKQGIFIQNNGCGLSKAGAFTFWLKSSVHFTMWLAFSSNFQRNIANTCMNKMYLWNVDAPDSNKFIYDSFQYQGHCQSYKLMTHRLALKQTACMPYKKPLSQNFWPRLQNYCHRQTVRNRKKIWCQS